jgi:trimethylamine--corrinoid protein Co-methyltransferase
MGSMQPTYAAPEAVMSQAGLMEMARRLYKLPTWGFSGCSASKVCDEQAVYEASHYLMMSAWMGCNINHDVGYLEFGLTFSFDLMVMCDEMIGHIRRMMEGISIDEESLGLEAIRRVGPGGNFLGDDHTFSHFKKNWKPGLTDRKTHDDWKADGATTMGQRAKAKIRSILENHTPEPLSVDTRREIDRILDEAEKRTRK